MGHTLTENGIQIDKKKVEAISKMDPPNNVKELKMFMGMVNYVQKFLPKISEWTKAIRTLDKKNVCWSWGPSQQREFDNIKNLIAKAPILSYYDPKKPVILQCDASQNGLGAVILQNGKPVAFASRTMIEAEKNYS